MPINKYFTFEEGKKILANNCHDSLKPREVDFADFTFKNPIQALTFAAYTDSIIPINENIGFQPAETGGIDGSGDVSNQFYKNLFLLKDFNKTNSVSESRLGLLSRPLHEIFRAFNDYLTIEKHLIFVYHHSLSETIKSIIERGYDPSNFVLYVSDGTLGEDFYNYPTIEYFKSEGYFTGFWTPRNGTDLIAVRIPEYQKQLEENGFIKGGASFFELELAPFGDIGHSKEHHFLDKYDMIYMEVENDMGLALNEGDDGIGQQAHLALPKSEVYGVGPVSDIASYTPKSGQTFGDRYRTVKGAPKFKEFVEKEVGLSWSEYLKLDAQTKDDVRREAVKSPKFEYPNRLGAIIFDPDGKMKVFNSEDQGFDEEDETISNYKAFLKFTLLNRLLIERIKKLIDAKSLDEFIKRIWNIDLSVILAQL